MRNHHRGDWYWVAISLTFMIAGLGVPVWSQDDATGSDTEPATTAEISQADRALRLERAIEADKAKLEEIKEDLAAREELFGTLTDNLKEAEVDVKENKRKLKEMGGAEASEEASALAKEVTELEEWIVIAKSQADLTFRSAKTLQDQIQSLEQKIAKEERDLKDLIGPTAEELKERAVSPEPEAPAEAAPAPALTPGQLLIPGSGAAPAETADAPTETPVGTAEQMEARREAEKAESEARQAEEAVLSFVDRKKALENQIEIEEQLLQTARESRDNLDLALEKAQGELEALIAREASREELRTSRSTVDTIQEMKDETQAEIDTRRDYLDSLQDRLTRLQEEQLAISQEAEKKRLEAEVARKRTIWLESPLHPRNLWRWLSTRGPRMLLVVVVTWALLALVRVSARRLTRTFVHPDEAKKRGANRADTIALSLRSAASLFIVVAGVLLVFQEAGVDVKTVLGGAAILGVAVAFGAQNLMRDYFTGFMILLEDQFELGDLITIGSITGTVERVNMRTTMLRDIEGRMHFIPNGEIKAVTNRTYVWGRAVLEIPIGFKEDQELVMDTILEVAEEFRQDPEMGDWVTDEPVMLGVDKFTENGLVIKFMIQTRPDKIFPTRRQLLRRIKKRFDEVGIEIAVPHRVLIQQKDDEKPT